MEVLLFPQHTEHAVHQCCCRQPRQLQSGNGRSSLPSQHKADCCVKRCQIVDDSLIGLSALSLLSSSLLPLCLPCRRKRRWRQGGGLLPLLIVKCPPPMANNCRTTTSSTLDADDNAWGNVIVAKMYAVRLCYYDLTAAVIKKTIRDCQGMLNVIQHALTITNFAIDQPMLLENDHKIAIMRWGRFSSCQKISLSLYDVCLFSLVI
jgi:hypothetical protein